MITIVGLFHLVFIRLEIQFSSLNFLTTLLSAYDDSHVVFIKTNALIHLS